MTDTIPSLPKPTDTSYDREKLLRMAKRNIAIFGGKTLEWIWFAGKVLLEEREKTKHGDWLPRLKQLGLAQRTAHRWMQVAKDYDKKDLKGETLTALLGGHKSDTVADLEGPQVEAFHQDPPAKASAPKPAKTPEAKPAKGTIKVAREEQVSEAKFTEKKGVGGEIAPALKAPAGQKKQTVAQEVVAQKNEKIAELRRQNGYLKSQLALVNDDGRPELMERMAELRKQQTINENYVGALLSLFTEADGLRRALQAYCPQGMNWSTICERSAIHEWAETQAGKAVRKRITGEG